MLTEESGDLGKKKEKEKKRKKENGKWGDFFQLFLSLL